MSGILILILSSVFSHAAINFATPERESLEFGFIGLEKVKITSPAGRIVVTPMPLNKVLVVFNKRAFTDECAVQAQRSVGLEELTVGVTRPAGSRCEADIEIQVPKDANLDISSETGSVEIQGMEGSLTFNLGSGSLTTTGGTLKKVAGKVGSGRINIGSLSGGGNLDIGSGDISVKFASDPRGEFAVKSGSGNINLMFPRGMRLKSELGSAAGSLNNEFSFDAMSPYALSVNTGAGDVNVKSY